MVGACRRRTVSEGSLSLTVVVNLDPKKIRRGVEGKDDQERASKGGGGGSGLLARGIRSRYVDVTCR